MAENKSDMDADAMKQKIASFKLKKRGLKTALTKAKNKLANLLEEEDPVRKEIRSAMNTVGSLLSKVHSVINDLGNAYKVTGETKLFEESLAEIDLVEKPIEEALNQAQAYLDNTRSTTASGVDTLGIGRLHAGYKPASVEMGTCIRKEVDHTAQQDKRERARAHYQKSFEEKGSEEPRHDEQWKAHFHDTPSLRQHDSHRRDVKPKVRYVSHGADDRDRQYVDTRYSIGEDMLRQLKRVSIPIFKGNVKHYEGWRAAFLACVDQAPASNEYKLLQLKQYLAGEAADVVACLGHSPSAYDIALERLDRRYGGKRRLIALRLDEITDLKPLRPGNVKDFDKFADLLDILVVCLRENDKFEELGDGCLYSMLTKKMTEDMLVEYHRYVFHCQLQESVETLRHWVLQEAGFRTIASETKSNLSKPHKDVSKSFFSSEEPKSNNCLVCKLPGHKLAGCQTFKDMDVKNRWSMVKKQKLCFRCLGTGHLGRNCSSQRKCGIDGCQTTHHPLLHSKSVPSESNRTPEIPKSRNVSSQSAQTVTMSAVNQDCYFSALRTIPVVLSNGKKSLVVNALLDDASNQTYLNEDVAEELGLTGEMQDVSVNVLNNQTENFSAREVHFKLHSLDASTTVVMSGLTTTKVTGSMPVIDWRAHQNQWSHLRGIPFPKIKSKPVVDLLIGMDHLICHSSLREVVGKPGEPVARLTPLGWTCIGKIEGSPGEQDYGSFVTVLARKQPETIDNALKALWEIDRFPESSPQMTPLEKKAVDAVEQSLDIKDGRYEVGIPWQDDHDKLPDNYNMAYKRLVSTERKLAKDKTVAGSYANVINDYMKKGYVRKVEGHEKRDTKWYLPHFPIIKPDRDTTKVRIVFDASAREQGVALNDVILPGPKLQNDLFEILLRFRHHLVALVCDVAEMYLQIGIKEVDRPFFRFLWRVNGTQEPEVFEFTRVVFGVNCSPFLAQFITQEHAKKHQEMYPLASEAIVSSTYMDDSMDSVQNDDKGLELYTELKTLWSSAGMHARKWNSNSAEVVSQIPDVDRLKQVDIRMNELPTMKTLGLIWHPEQDVFTFSNTSLSQRTSFTKRSFLQETARIFDPLGLLAPFTVRAKSLLQQIWISGADWDDMLNPDLNLQACQWHAEIGDLPLVSFPRCLTLKGSSNMTLHVFADASEEAYGAVIYGVTSNEHHSSSQLISAKSRVAPLKSVSIPRLELLAAVLGVKLVLAVTHALKTALQAVTFWSDSMNVLCWIRHQSRSFKPFVANRVGYIHEHTNPEQWKYVPTKLNPADILSRGCSVQKLNESSWQNGPDFLLEEESEHPKQPSVFDLETTELKPKKTKPVTFVTPNASCNKPWRLSTSHYSNLTKLKRVMAWVLRFICNTQSKPENRKSGELDVEDLQDAETRILLDAQKEAFPEYELLKSGKSLPTKSKVCRLQPFIDDSGLMRSAGRLKHAEVLPYDTRCPIILPRHHWTTRLVVKYFHDQCKHSGTNQTLSALSSRFWVLSAREEIRECENWCARCTKDKAKPASQVMADLPSMRVSMAKAFDQVAVDFAGPFLTVQGRGKVRQKRYLCLFTCLVTRAVHLEMAYGLDSDSFLRAFFRMADRRGMPTEILSDNGTNFVGASKELRALVSSGKVQSTLTNKGIVWRFNPPHAPHFGGVFESLIKSAKRAIYAVLSSSDVTDEELLSTFTGAEALMNSRPLTYQSSHVQDDVPLTPNHFLLGQAGCRFAPELDESFSHPRKRWRRVQELQRHFWKRWMREWLPSLNVRNKWFTPKRDLQDNDVVILVSPDSPRGKWPLGKVIKTYPGKDGHVRVVDLKVGDTVLTRPITKVCPLEWN